MFRHRTLSLDSRPYKTQSGKRLCRLCTGRGFGGSSSRAKGSRLDCDGGGEETGIPRMGAYLRRTMSEYGYTKSDKYRQRAAECLRLSKRAAGLTDSLSLLDLALRWHLLAQRAGCEPHSEENDILSERPCVAPLR